ncbi:MAG: hypothetical protein ACR2NB_05305 [Solirubrobacteraceae bacterium]
MADNDREAHRRWAQHMARYVISDDYAPRYCASKGAVYTDGGWLNALLHMCPRDQLLVAITAGTRAAGAGSDALAQWTAYVLDHAAAGLDTLLRDVLEADDGGPPRVLVARQPLLLALKLALEHDPPASTGTSDPFVVATLLSHYAAREPATGRIPDDAGRRVGGYAVPLAMEIVANTLFNAPVEYGDLLARTRLLWTAYEQRLTRATPRLPLRQLLREATGMDLDDLLVLAFGVFAHADTAAAGAAQPLDLASMRLPQASIDTFLSRFSATAADLAASLGGAEGEWSFLPIEDTPLLRTGATTAAVIDIRLMQRRFTSALYWLVHDHEKAIDDQQRRLWTQVYSELVELYAEDILARLAPTRGGQTTFFSEEQLKLLGDTAVDCGIDFGDYLLIADVVQHQMTVPTRALCQIDAFEKDMHATVHKKVRQLNGSIRALLGKPTHPAHPTGARPQRILPVVVQGADFPVNPATVGYARERAAADGLLAQPECGPLVIVTLDELEMLDSLRHTGIATADEVLHSYAATGALNALRNFVIETYGGTGLRLPPQMQGPLDEVFDMVQRAYAHLDQP